MEGQTVSHYRILKKIGEGGMGVVYLAEDTSLKRKVALKFLPDYLRSDEVAPERFVREAQSAAALDHPFICKMYETGEVEGRSFIAMEYVSGQTLKEKLSADQIPLKEALQIGVEVAEALERAHNEGIVHRDLKPANIMLTEEGHAKVMDFGLAKRLSTGDDKEGEITAALTQEGTTLGTLNYMSPEQLRGQPVDSRSDVFSFGVVLYEMLTGIHPFRKETQAATINATFNEAARPLAHYVSEIPTRLQEAIDRMLAKEPDRRYSTTGELTKTLRDCRELLAERRTRVRNLLRQPRTLAFALLLIISVTAGVAWLWIQYSRTQWVHSTAIPEINRLIDENRFYPAFKMIQKAQQLLPKDVEVQRLHSMVTTTISVVTDPDEANVFVRDYNDIEGSWDLLGESPVEEVFVPRAPLVMRITKEGFETVERGLPILWDFQVKLEPSGRCQSGMVRVSGGSLNTPWADNVALEPYWIDKFEVTNRQYQEFVSAGGYATAEYWKEPFASDGETLSWKLAIASFLDKTGRPGPSTWEVGAFPQGEEEYPVRGVSWYEAAAFCESQGKVLPTAYHWQLAATGQASVFSSILDLSNFDRVGPAATGDYKGISAAGAYDMAGNVKEWCFNQSEKGRAILGGAWDDAPYVFLVGDATSPLTRDSNVGFRCAKYGTEVPEDLMAPIRTQSLSRDYRVQKPVGDSEFEMIRAFYSYDRGELRSQTDEIDEASQIWRKERISFDAAYGDERVVGHLYLPRNAAPPFQTVIYFPGLNTMFQESSEKLGHDGIWLDPIIKSGRAVLFPIYKGTFERSFPKYPRGTDQWTQLRIQWAKDLGRSIDYLETRPDIDSKRLAYCGYSMGAREGFNLTAIEQRFKASVLLAVGTRWVTYSPEMEPINFAPRVKTPTLMIQGRYDALANLEAIVKPLYQALGVQEPERRLVFLDSGHSLPRLEVIPVTLDWLDQHLGLVELKK